MTLTTTRTLSAMLLPRGNRVLNRRKSGGGDRFERTNHTYGNDAEKYQSYSRNFPIMEHGELGKPHSNSSVIALDGCCSSNASRLLNERWMAAISSYNDSSIDLSERPLMYSGGSRSSWGHMKLPHQLVRMDFPTELRHSILNANAAEMSSSNVDRSRF